MPVDFNQARILVRNALQTAVECTIDEFKLNESVYALCMVFRDDYDDMTAAAASLESLERRQSVARDPNDPVERLQTKWQWLGGVNNETGMLFRDAAEYMTDMAQNETPEFQARYMWTLVKAIKDVADTGIFERGSQEITLFCTAVDTDIFWLERASARYLNSPELFAIFSQEHHESFYETQGNPADDYSYIVWEGTRPTAKLWRELILQDHV